MANGKTAAEPFASRWKRRVRTIPTMLAITVAGVVASPLVLTAAAIMDIAKGRLRMPTVRVALFLLQYAINDSIEIVLAPMYWIVAGFGTRLGQPSSVGRHERLQRWSLDVMVRRAERLLGLRIDLDAQSMQALYQGPAIVLCRHVNVLDSALPTVLCQRRGYRTRGAIMAELLVDPGFDLIYGRTGSVFIPRDNGSVARAMLARLCEGLDSRTAIVIFPEGRLFRPDRLEPALSRLAEHSPERAMRLAPLRHVLPPRPGGVLAVLAAIPGADVVVMAHTGLERFGSFTDLAKAVPLGDPIRVVAWRVPATEIPSGDHERTKWLDDQWLRVDDWVAQSSDRASHAS